MAEKKKESESVVFRALKGAISRVGSSVEGLKSEIEGTIEDAKKRIHSITESLFAHIMILFLIMLGLVFLFLGATFKIIEIGLDKGSAFLFIGILILALGWVFLLVLRRRK
ncbi:MAG: hypothetical protein ACP5N3_03875 [Candidatus Nanoarchaeia archaeon]